MAREVAVIVGAGEGLSAALARACAREGMAVALAARRPERIAALAAEAGGRAYGCDVARREQVEALFAAVGRDLGVPALTVHNPSYRARGPFLALDPPEVEKTLAVTAYGGFLVAQAALRAMVPAGRGTLIFTGASASVKGYAQSAPFAMAKFALRGLAQSLAREMQPQGIHVAHVVIDGGIRSAARPAGPGGRPDALLDPAAIAETYLQLHRQPRSAWSTEVELRPWVESF